MMMIKPIVYKSILDPKSEEVLDHVFHDRMEYLGLMSSAVVHQLQIPLIIMRGRVESYLRHPEISPRQTLVEFSKEFEQLLKLLDTMIFVAPPTKEIKQEPIAIKDMIQRLMVIFESSCVKNAISYQVNIDDQLRIFSEPNRVRHILLALITNAVDSFLFEEKAKSRNILFHTHFDAAGINLIISDTGCGMSDEVQKNILTKPFYSTKVQQASSGLGLALSRKMASDLNIDMSFVSEQGKGTSFNLSFPKNLYSLESKESKSASSSESESEAKL